MVVREVGSAPQDSCPGMVLRPNNGGPDITVQLSQEEAIMAARRIFSEVKVIFEFKDL